jgi:hypothetical protein
MSRAKPYYGYSYGEKATRGTDYLFAEDKLLRTYFEEKDLAYLTSGEAGTKLAGEIETEKDWAGIT